MTITVNELFAGIGAFRKALLNLHIPHQIIGISEIDKFALLSYEALYGKTKNYGDIRKIEKLDYADLWTYGFPCQDISIAGKGNGIEQGKTRSGLLYEVKRLLLNSQNVGELPKYLIMENVKNLVSKKFKDDFEKWLLFLENLGYRNYWKVLNAKDYGIPQNRERVFCISILGNENFHFPEKQPLRITLQNMLEDTVDETYYLSSEQVNRITFSTFHSENSRIQRKEYCDSLLSRDYNGSKCVLIKNGTKAGVLPAMEGDGIDLAYPSSKNRRGRVQPQQAHTLTTSNTAGVLVKQIGQYNTSTRLNSQRYRVYDKTGLSPTISTCSGGNLQPFITTDENEQNFRIRKLTPREYWRLMGFDDDDFNKARNVCSNTQLYKQAGNSIVVNVLERILERLLFDDSLGGD